MNTTVSTAPAGASTTNKQRAGWLLLIALGLLAPMAVYPTFLMKVLCFALFASAFNLLLGFAGLLSFGHAAFFGGSAYVCAALAKNYGLSPELAILAGAAFAAVLGALFGWLSIRRSGIYLTMITLALAQLVFFFAVQLPFTGGEDGLQGVPRGALLGFIPLADNQSMYYFVFAVFCAGFWLIHRTVHSPYGQVLKAIRENEPRAISLGYDVARYKLMAFVLSASMAGVAGALKALVFQLASLTDVHWHMSGEVVLMTLLGGLGTIFGPAVGAFTIVVLENELADKVGPWVTVIMGGIFVVCVLAFRRGLVGELLALRGDKAPPGGH
ncbi:MAG: branched-chain amino acid ABC transporter permease [Hydrogenophaga sp.]|jgi:branched-chain amino acid transport system permease protein|uniref:branched-chain amino acid ABC transporter permease n=1 Tax=Hydrogenophaga sp. TaxID=1904254 RepID=UPI003D0A1DE7